jgi:hypothetical protein
VTEAEEWGGQEWGEWGELAEESAEEEWEEWEDAMVWERGEQE